LRTGSFWIRLAAASGIGFAGAAVAAYVIGAVKDFSSASDVAASASANVWGTWVLLVALAGVLLVWFTATSAARLQEIEGGSGRIAAEHRMAGAAIAALLFVEVAAQIAARSSAPGSGIDALARALVNGPVLPFAAGVYVLAAGVVGTRAGASIPTVSGVIARLSVLLGLALVAGGGLWLFRDYAWLNDSVFFAFTGWVFVRSVLGTFRWADIDDESLPLTVARATRREPPAATTMAMPTQDLDDTFEVPRIRSSRSKPKAATRRPKPKAAARKPAARKPAERKAPERKPARKPARKRAPRKPAPGPTPSAAEERVPETEPVLAADEPETASLDTLDDLDFGPADEDEES
jgi:hypothetical protein